MVGTKVPLPCTFPVAAVPRCTQQSGFNSSVFSSLPPCSDPPSNEGQSGGRDHSSLWESSGIQKPKDFSKPGNGISTYDERAYCAIETTFVWKKMIFNTLEFKDFHEQKQVTIPFPICIIWQNKQGPWDRSDKSIDVAVVALKHFSFGQVSKYLCGEKSPKV